MVIVNVIVLHVNFNENNLAIYKILRVNKNLYSN